MKVSYVSDLHLEFLDYYDFSDDEGGDVLLLAGDILTAHMVQSHRTDKDSRKLKKFLLTKFKSQLLDKYKHVLYIAGNHEHYNSIYKHTLPTIKEFLKKNKFDNVLVMENDFIDIDGIRFIGCTLWTDYDKGNPLSMEIIERGMNDYRLIGLHDVDDMNYFNRGHNRKINPQYLLDVHLESVAYIWEKVRDTINPVVILAHHAPSFKSINPDHLSGGFYGADSLNGAYASDLSNVILDNENIKYFIHGHTHHNVDYMIGQCRVLANCKGYNFEVSSRFFEGTKSFDIGE